MNIKYKEDPRAWRKSTLLTVLALLVLSSLLRWRHVLTVRVWTVVLLVLACVAIAVWSRPSWFRSYYRFSTWSGFWSSQWVARGFLAIIFILLILPAGVVMRLLGKDALHLRRSTGVSSYWKPAEQGGSLDRLF